LIVRTGFVQDRPAGQPCETILLPRGALPSLRQTGARGVRLAPLADLRPAANRAGGWFLTCASELGPFRIDQKASHARRSSWLEVMSFPFGKQAQGASASRLWPISGWRRIGQGGVSFLVEAGNLLAGYEGIEHGH